jgi:hypothetical protein
MALTEGNQRFFSLLHLDPYRTGGFILLMLGVGVPGGKEFGTGFGDSQIDDTTAGFQLTLSKLPQFWLRTQAWGTPHIG